MDKRFINDHERHGLTPWSSSNDVEFRSNKQGIGDGERKFAAEIGGRVMGQLSHYDVVDDNGTKFEVKKVDRAYSDVRVGSSASGIVMTILRDLCDIVAQLARAFNHLDARASFGDNGFEIIKEFLEEDAPKILIGSVSHGRLFGSTSSQEHGLRQVLDIASSAVKKTQTEQTKTTVVVGAELFQVDDMTLSKLKRVLDDCGHLSATSRQWPEELQHRAFYDPSSFFSEIAELTTASRAFSDVDAVVLVNERGYLIVAHHDLNEMFSFKGMSCGQMKFNVFMNKIPNETSARVMRCDKTCMSDVTIDIDVGENMTVIA